MRFLITFPIPLKFLGINTSYDLGFVVSIEDRNELFGLQNFWGRLGIKRDHRPSYEYTNYFLHQLLRRLQKDREDPRSNLRNASNQAKEFSINIYQKVPAGTEQTRCSIFQRIAEDVV